MSRTETKREAADEVWAQLLRMTRLQRDRFVRISAELDLSPGDVRTLLTLDDEQGRPMGQLARLWRCDASYVTAMVDRLEQRGLVERRSAQPDRRVKQATLTAEGARMRAAVLTRLHELPPELLELDHATLVTVRDALSRLQAIEP
jgi:MarR family transcriptional regulator, organic hydroperoxide resistance regulator